MTRLRTLLAATAILAATVNVAMANDDLSNKVFARIETECAAKWAPDYQMQLSCRTTQANAALRVLQAFKTAGDLKQNQALSIITTCSQKWNSPLDFVMIDRCIDGAQPAPTPQASTPPAPPVVYEPQAPANPQSTAPVAPSTLPANKLGPLSTRLAEINQLMRQSLPIAVRHCGSDATCRKEQTAAIHELAAKETVIAKALRNPTTYTSTVLENDTVNACIAMWSASEDFAATLQCINDAAQTM